MDATGDLVCWVGDGLVPVTEARVSVFDRGFRTGEGVFETLRVYGTHPFRLDAHLRRALDGAAVLGFAFDLDTAGGAIERTATANRAVVGNDSAVRLTVTPGPIDPTSPHPGRAVGPPTIVVTTAALADAGDVHDVGVSAAIVPWAREIPHVKAVSYLAAVLARREAHRQGAFEALLTDTSGRVLEGSGSNVFAVVQGRLLTPPVDAGILAGVTRAVVLEVAARQGVPVETRPLTVTELVEADEAFLTQTTREVVPLVRVGGRRVGDGRPGPLTQALHEGYRDEVRREVEAAGRG